MADTLLGMVIENLGSLVREGVADFMNVGQLTQKFSGNITAIRAVLKDAEEKQIMSHAVKDWLQKLTDAAHVLDDIMDEASIQQSTPNDCSCVTPFHPKMILARHNIGKRMKETAQRFDDIAEERRRFGLHVESKPEDDEWRQTTSVVTDAKVFGRDLDKERVVEFLLRYAIDIEEFSVYSIVGIGGHGKTTLAQLVFNDDRVSKHFDLKIWVCVSDDFSMMKVLQSIYESATGENPNLLSLESLQKKVQQVLQNKRYLLVLDDVWNEDQGKWERFKYFMQCANRTKGASLLVTTRLETVASIMGTYPAHHLSGISENDIWSLFKQHAFGPSNEDRVELQAIGKDIVGKCVGSPLAAKALGSLLRFKNEEHQWLSVKESKLWNLPEGNPIMKALQLSYFNLKLSLRPCFSFCAIFPKDSVMVKEDLIHLWMANGFISSRGNLEVEHVGNEVWNELYQRSFFQEVDTNEDGKITFKMHDLVHDLTQSIMGEECVVSEFASFTNLSSRVHHIGCSYFNKPVDYNMIPLKKVESLRTFLESGQYLYNPNLGVLPSISPLRALRTSSFQLSTLKNFIHLRYLEIYGSYIITLPESVCELHKLQILKLQSCDFLTSIPQHLTQLQDLRHLVIKDCESLTSMPSQIGNLTCLKTLSIFIVGSKARCGLAELHDLQLGGKLHIRGLENVPNEWDARQANLAGKKDLNGLYLTWGRHGNSQGNGANAAESILEALKPHSGLKNFGMMGYVGTQLPRWMGNTSLLKGLVDLILYDCKNCQRLPPLGKLPCLTNLFIIGMKDVKYVDHDLYDPTAEKAFASLKRLTLRRLPNLERILEAEAEGLDTLPQLSYLRLSGVPKLVLPSLPSVRTIYAHALRSDENAVFFLGEVLCRTRRLKTLGIQGFNKLKVLPDELGSLSELEKLDIACCDELESFPEHIMRGLSSLRSLSVEDCPKFKSLSEAMGHLTGLEVLHIAMCPQLVLLSNMDRLTTLRKMIIRGSKDQICILPEGLEHIPSLQILELSVFHSLTSLPDWLGLMTSLQNLEINNCPELRSLPDSLQQLNNLRELCIKRCPKLVRRCRTGTGEDWQKIAHIPDLDIDTERTFCDIFKAGWKIRKHFLFHTHSKHFTAEDDFNIMVGFPKRLGG